MIERMIFGGSSLTQYVALFNLELGRGHETPALFVSKQKAANA